MMDTGGMQQVLEKIDSRLERIEQKLPTLAVKDELAAAISRLATKDELAAAIAPLATKAELAAAIAPLATKAELAAAIAPLATRAELREGLREEGEKTRQFTRVLFESLEEKIEILADGVLALDHKLTTHAHPELTQAISGLDVRVSALEAGRRPRKAS